MESSEREQLQGRVIAAIDERRAEIVDAAQQIHDRPELAFQERFASGLLAEALRRHGYGVEYPVGGVETAFRAVKAGGSGEGPTVAVLAEYDALPGIGHGCAHNLIASSALAAGIGLSAVMDELGGTFQVIGTPAEEAGGGKIALIEAGVFAGIDAALMVHHAGDYTGAAEQYPGGTSLAVSDFKFEFHGRSAHAAHDPWKGANALNGVIHLFNGIDALRQHIRSEARIHGIIRHGGDAPNVVPHYASAEFYVRAGDVEYLRTLEAKVRAIAVAAAAMTETTVEITPMSPTYFDERPSYVLGRRYNEHMRAMGLELRPERPERGAYSTDFGNVTYLMPAITGSFAISREAISGHSPAVVEAACSEFGQEQMLKVSKAMALTALDLFAEPALLAESREEHGKWGER
ncbi:MAG TPA: M20 family metallopeptidase [Ktedonobacterales bacterium]|nr:M20 family metallopeptidase [Ktedonobacterales bacterium]